MFSCRYNTEKITFTDIILVSMPGIERYVNVKKRGVNHRRDRFQPLKVL